MAGHSRQLVCRKLAMEIDLFKNIFIFSLPQSIGFWVWVGGVLHCTLLFFFLCGGLGFNVNPVSSSCSPSWLWVLQGGSVRPCREDDLRTCHVIKI